MIDRLNKIMVWWFSTIKVLSDEFNNALKKLGIFFNKLEAFTKKQSA